jgi:pimeloyl-ACP methyl ester carboxylesterase
MPEIKLSQGIIYYEIYGKGPALIGLHQGASCAKTWKYQIERFSKDFTFVIYDRLGHGRSQRHLPYEEKYFQHRANELGELISSLGLDFVHLCGLCEGGAVAFVFACTNPERVKTLVLQGVGYRGTDQTIARCEAYFGPWAQINDALKNRLNLYHGQEYAPLKWEALREAKPYVWSKAHDLRPGFSSIKVPTVIIGGDRDEFFDLGHPIMAYEGINDSELCIMPGVGHFANEQAPDLFNQIVMEFVERRTGQGKGEQ